MEHTKDYGIFNPNKKYSNLCFTLNNYFDIDIKEIKSAFKNTRYYVMGYEIGKSGTPHIQGYVEYGRQVLGKTLTKICDGRIHWENRFGTSNEALEYCKKDGKFDEVGTPCEQGERTDIKSLRDRIVSGETNIDKIIVEDPQSYHNFGRTLEEIQIRKYNMNSRKEMTQGMWYYGSTNIGKSHRAYECTELTGGPDSVYTWEVWNDKKGAFGWQDDYRQQDVIVIDDFRGEIAYSNMLKLCDKFPCKIPMRNKQSMFCTSKYVIVTSAKPPWDVYCNQVDNTDSINQLLRRFCVYTRKNQNEDWVQMFYCTTHSESYRHICKSCERLNKSKTKNF